MKLTLKLNDDNMKSKVQSNKFGLFVSHEWHRLIDPYTPRRTGALMRNVDEEPFKLHYKQPYAARMYYGRNFHFNTNLNKLATAEWDTAAAEQGKLDQLYRALNNGLKNGNI